MFESTWLLLLTYYPPVQIISRMNFQYLSLILATLILPLHPLWQKLLHTKTNAWYATRYALDQNLTKIGGVAKSKWLESGSNIGNSCGKWHEQVGNRLKSKSQVDSNTSWNISLFNGLQYAARKLISVLRCRPAPGCSGIQRLRIEAEAVKKSALNENRADRFLQPHVIDPITSRPSGSGSRSNCSVSPKWLGQSRVGSKDWAIFGWKSIEG